MATADAFEARLEAELTRKFGAIIADNLTTEAINALSGGNVEGFLNFLDWVGFTQDVAEITAILADVGRTAARRQLASVVARAQRRAEEIAGRQILPELTLGVPPRTHWEGAGLTMPPHGVIQIGFDVVDMNTLRWAEKRAALLVVEVADDMRTAIRMHALGALRGGMTTQEMARNLARIVPLHSRFANAVVRRHATLLRQGLADGLSPARAAARAARMSDTYAARLTRLRARTIARTEVMFAENFGRLESYRTAIESGLLSNPAMGRGTIVREWITAEDERVCEVCGPLNGVQVDWSDPFPTGAAVPPAHPNCRCSFNVIDNLDQFDYDGAGTAENEFAGVIQQ